jgi:hypothetical protein
MESHVQMMQRYQVFVSSTFLDLQPARQVVLHSLMEMRCIPVGMELFPAASESQWNFITRTILECDYYLVIVGGRYGSLASDGISYTEKEYRFALDHGKPTIAFLHANPTALTHRETDAARIAKLESFRDLCQSKLCKLWTSPEGLGAAVTASIWQLIQDKPSFGWIHGERYRALERSYSEARDYIRRLSFVHQASSRYNDRVMKHQILSNGVGVLLEEFTLMPDSKPVSLYLTRYGFYSPTGAPCNPKVHAWDAGDRSPLSVCEIERNDLSVLFAIMLDRPSTTDRPVKLHIKCERDNLWSSLLSDGVVDNRFTLDKPCNVFEMKFEAPPEKRWNSFRATPSVGEIKIDNDMSPPTISWKISDLHPMMLGYRLVFDA